MAPEAIDDLERLLPGEGVVDFAGFFAGLAAAGYDGAVTPEVLGSTARATRSRAPAGARRDARRAAYRSLTARCAVTKSAPVRSA